MKIDINALIDAVILQESGGNASAESAVGALGLMQIMPATWKEWAPRVGVDIEAIRDPEANREVGTAYLSFLLKRYAYNVALALAAYNWGLGHVDKVFKQFGATATPRDVAHHVPLETHKYIKNILWTLISNEAVVLS